ncbi:protein MCM10 homolog [Elgaria multicarinata webbii]|uniref:protein MCM10 homolog n=1 Tax=Elgaria multicarinata webbii TaxID=159646 RepID=UPI002FCD1714
MSGKNFFHLVIQKDPCFGGPRSDRVKNVCGNQVTQKPERIGECPGSLRREKCAAEWTKRQDLCLGHIPNPEATANCLAEETANQTAEGGGGLLAKAHGSKATPHFYPEAVAAHVWSPDITVWAEPLHTSTPKSVSPPLWSPDITFWAEPLHTFTSPGGELEDSADGVSKSQEPGTLGSNIPGIPQLLEAELDIINPVQRRRSRRMEQKKGKPQHSPHRRLPTTMGPHGPRQADIFAGSPGGFRRPQSQPTASSKHAHCDTAEWLFSRSHRFIGIENDTSMVQLRDSREVSEAGPRRWDKPVSRSANCLITGEFESFVHFLPDDDNLDLLASLLEENEASAEQVSGENGVYVAASGDPDEYDELFDAEDDESYTEEVGDDERESHDQTENVAELFGDVGDLSEEEEEATTVQGTSQPLAVDQAKEKANQHLQDELRKLQEQMKKLQDQLQMTAIGQPVNTAPSKKKSGQSPAAPLMERKLPKLQESPCFSAQLNCPALPPSKGQCQKPKPSLPGNKSPAPKPAPTLVPQPLKSVTGNRPGVGPSQKSQAPKNSGVIHQDVSLEVFSGLRLRTPRVSSVEMERKMAGRTFIRLSQLQDKLASVNLEETDWVTFGVILKKVTPQSSNNGKTFSIWRLNDLRDFSRCVSLFLFGDVHKEHWKTDQGMVIGLLNANLMKPKEGSDEVCVSVDHPQKILLLGKAMDLGTCKARKKNGEPCTQIVNLNECEYCQYHVQSQYRRLSSKRADLQSTFSNTRAPKRTAKKNVSLKERLCQEGFYYGGVSSAAYAASAAAAAAPKKKIQTTLSNLVVRGADAILQETKQRMGLPKQPLPCSEEFKELLSAPSFGARNLNKHLAKASASVSVGKQGPAFQSISASALLKQQKQQMLEVRKRRSEELQRRFLQNTSSESRAVIPSSSGPSTVRSPTPGAKFPKTAKLSSPQTPRLAAGFSEEEDVLFFDNLPLPAPKLNGLAEAKKMAAINKLRAKGQVLSKVDPNGIKRKRSDLDVLEIAERVEKNIPVSEDTDAAEPAEKKRRQQLAYLESDEFQEILNARSKHTGVLKEFEAELQERYFDPLVKKEQMEEKMRSIRELKCRVATCKTCKYTYFKLLDSCVEQNHDYHWHDGVKRFFKCPCGNRAISLDKLPKKHCSNCGLFKWERDGMLKEKKGPKIGAETLLPRGEERAKFLNSLK